VPEVELLSIPEAAQRLGVDPRTVREAIGRGDIPVTLVGQRLKISARTIDTIIASAVVEVTTGRPGRWVPRRSGRAGPADRGGWPMTHSLPPPYESKYPTPQRPRHALIASADSGPTFADHRAARAEGERRAAALARANLLGRIDGYLADVPVDIAVADGLNGRRIGPHTMDWLLALGFTPRDLHRYVTRKFDLHAAQAAKTRPSPQGRGVTAGGRFTGTGRPPVAAQPSNADILAARRQGVSERDLGAALRLGLNLTSLHASGPPQAWLGGRPTDRRAGPPGPNGCRLPGHGARCLCDGTRRRSR
jgi:excisionase family DNA binding protein